MLSINLTSISSHLPKLSILIYWNVLCVTCGHKCLLIKEDRFLLSFFWNWQIYILIFWMPICNTWLTVMHLFLQEKWCIIPFYFLWFYATGIFFFYLKQYFHIARKTKSQDDSEDLRGEENNPQIRSCPPCGMLKSQSSN